MTLRPPCYELHITNLRFMNKLIRLFLFIFPLIVISQENESFSMQNMYLSEFVHSFDENSFLGLDTDNVNWRKETVKKITSKSNIQEASFLKTVMVLHMLKYKLGDAIFYKAIEHYKNDVEEQNLEVDLLDLQYYLEDGSGIELTYFFNDWFKSKGHPSYQISWFQNEDTNEASFTVKQLQSDASVSFFELPVPIKLIGTKDQSQLVRLELSENGQSFNASIPFKIKSIEFDPETQLISNNNIVKVGIDQEILNKEISLYPNPAIDLIKIQNSSEAVVEKVSIYNMLGKLVLEKSNPLISINLKPLSEGMHLVKIETSQGTLHKTILKK